MIDLKQDLTYILAELIKIPSPTGKEAVLLSAIKESIKSSVKKIKLKIEHDDGNNLLLCLNPESKSPYTLLLAGHIDTVPISNEKQILAEIKHSNTAPIMYGRGSVDMKAGLSAMLKLASDFDRGLLNFKYKTKLLFYSGEEGPLPNGLSHVLDSGKLHDVSACIIPEPTASQFAIACMGAITLELMTKGKAAHSAWPEKGSNAVYNSINLIEKIKNFGIKKARLNGMEYFETMNITKIRTENPHNVIPDKTFLTINYRFSPDKTKEEAIEHLFNYLNMSKGDIKNIKIIDTSPSSHIANLKDNFFDKEIFQSKDKELQKIIFQAWSDIAQLNQKGIPAVNYGPGNISHAHMDDEQINLKDLKKYYEEFKNIICKY
jgi:succinyl-diaminopimelate desuccinylase